jgi:hypothetical protein
VTQLLKNHNTQRGKNTNPKHQQTHNGTQTKSIQETTTQVSETGDGSRTGFRNVVSFFLDALSLCAIVCLFVFCIGILAPLRVVVCE